MIKSLLEKRRALYAIINNSFVRVDNFPFNCCKTQGKKMTTLIVTIIMIAAFLTYGLYDLKKHPIIYIDGEKGLSEWIFIQVAAIIIFICFTVCGGLYGIFHELCMKCRPPNTNPDWWR